MIELRAYFWWICLLATTLCMLCPSNRVYASGNKIQVSSQSITQYVNDVKKALMHSWTPAKAAKAHAAVMFRIHKNGAISWMELTDASAVKAVNEAAEDAIVYAAPFPPLPAGISHIDLSVDFSSDISCSSKTGYSRPTAERATKAYKLWTEADKDLNAKDYFAGIDKLEAANELCPFNTRYKNRLAEIFLLAANTCTDKDEKAFLLHNALLMHPNESLARERLSQFWKEQGKDPNDFETRLALARAYRTNGHPIDALAEYNETWLLQQEIQLIPEINLVLKQREAFKSLKKWQSIVNRMRTPDNLYNLGNAYEASGNYLEAKAFYEATLREDPSYVFAQAAIEELLSRKNEEMKDVSNTILSQSFPLTVQGGKSIKIALVQNRQPVVDYFRWSCAGKAVHRWTPGRFPLRLYIKNGYSVPGHRANFDGMIINAFRSWAQASENRFSYVVVNSPTGANITVTWTANPSDLKGGGNEQGLTYFKYMMCQPGNYTICGADITILMVKRHNGTELDDNTMKSVCLHEVGHALGVAGHSPYAQDVMYPVMMYGFPTTALTSRDKATIKHLYQGYPHL